MSYSVDDIDGLSERLRRRLHQLGVGNTKDLLDRVKKAGVAPLVDGADAEEFGRLVAIADLLRVQGIGTTYVLLLLKAGVSSAAELAQHEVEGLMAALKVAKPDVKGLRRLPTRREVECWIVFAAGLPPVRA